MIIDGIRFSSFQRSGMEAIAPFIDFLERKLGVRVLYDSSDIPFGRADLVPQLKLAQLLLKHGIISKFEPVYQFDDDPRMKVWFVTTTSANEKNAGGISIDSDADALMAALAEALERYLWREADDYSPRIRASAQEMVRGKKRFIPPERFAGYSGEQREERHDLRFDEKTVFTWMRAVSLFDNKPIFLPMQTVSAKWPIEEPSIRPLNTTGLATWPTRTGARLRGALECIERDAYSIMWFNQLSLPRLRLDTLRAGPTSLSRLLEQCDRYRLKVHAVELLTDAPTYAIMAVVEDMSGQPPRFAIGLKAGRTLAYTVEKSLLEALRGHRSGRYYAAQGPWDDTTPIKQIGHFERTHYWTSAHHAPHLEFLIKGKEKDIDEKPWEQDSEEAHLSRIVSWCRSRGYECVSVPLTASKKNPTPLHVEMAVIPELQPMHLFEKNLMRGGTRWKSVPERGGIKGRAEMFEVRPHPFS